MFLENNVFFGGIFLDDNTSLINFLFTGATGKASALTK